MRLVHTTGSILLHGGIYGLMAIASACRGTRAPPIRPPDAIRFEEMFSQLDSVSLASQGDSLRFVVGGLVTRDRILVVDDSLAQLRLYRRRAGTLVGAVGGPGDGLGEFRHPMAVAQLDSGQFVVFDRGRRLMSLRDSLGRVIRETLIPGSFFNGFVVLAAEQRAVFSGEVFGPRIETKGFDLHEFDLSGRHAKSYGRPPKPESDWESKFAAEFAGYVGNSLVTGWMYSNRLRFHDRVTHAERWIEVAPGWQHLEWPSDGLLRRTASRQTVAQRISAWAHQQRLMNGVFPLAPDRLVVRFLGYAPNGERLFSYVLMDMSGRTLAISDGTPAQILGTRADTAFWLTCERCRTPMLRSGIAATLPPKATPLTAELP